VSRKIHGKNKRETRNIEIREIREYFIGFATRASALVADPTQTHPKEKKGTEYWYFLNNPIHFRWQSDYQNEQPIQTAAYMTRLVGSFVAKHVVTESKVEVRILSTKKGYRYVRNLL
jgi:hypothetical protein